MSKPYILELIKITDAKGKVTYQAGNTKMIDNIIQTSADYTYLGNPDIQFEAEFLGEVQVYLEE